MHTNQHFTYRSERILEILVIRHSLVGILYRYSCEKKKNSVALLSTVSDAYFLFYEKINYFKIANKTIKTVILYDRRYFLICIFIS